MLKYGRHWMIKKRTQLLPLLNGAFIVRRNIAGEFFKSLFREPKSRHKN